MHPDYDHTPEVGSHHAPKLGSYTQTSIRSHTQTRIIHPNWAQIMHPNYMPKLGSDHTPKPESHTQTRITSCTQTRIMGCMHRAPKPQRMEFTDNWEGKQQHHSCKCLCYQCSTNSLTVTHCSWKERGRRENSAWGHLLLQHSCKEEFTWLQPAALALCCVFPGFLFQSSNESFPNTALFLVRVIVTVTDWAQFNPI